MAYEFLTEGIKSEARETIDEMLEEPYLEEFPEGFERAREEARRFARSRGIDTGTGLQQAFNMPQVGGGPVLPL